MESKNLTIVNNIEQLDHIQLFLEQLGAEWSLDHELVFQLNLVLEEYISNLVCYGYPDKAEHEISVEISKEEDNLSIVIYDDAKTFNILDFPANAEIEKPLSERKIGGLGIHFIRSLMDHIDYESDERGNRLRMVKKIITS